MFLNIFGFADLQEEWEHKMCRDKGKSYQNKGNTGEFR